MSGLLAYLASKHNVVNIFDDTVNLPALPVELWDNIIRLGITDDPVIMDEKLDLIEFDEGYFNFSQICRGFRESVHKYSAGRLVIRAGRAVRADLAAGHFGDSVVARDVSGAGNYSRIIPYSVSPVPSTDHPNQAGVKFLLQYATRLQVVAIELTHPSQLLAVDAQEQSTWATVLEHLRGLEQPLAKYFTNMDFGWREKPLTVIFMPRTRVEDCDTEILRFEGSPDTHWKYQHVQQVCVTLSYLSSLVDERPSSIMRIPAILAAKPTLQTVTSAEIVQHTYDLAASLKRAFINQPVGNTGQVYSAHHTSWHSDLAQFHCFDRGWHDGSDWTPAYLVRNLHEIPFLTAGNIPIANTGSFAISKVILSTNTVIGQWKSEHGVLGQASTYLSQLSIYPQGVPELERRYGDLHRQLAAFRKLLSPPNRLPADLKVLRDGPITDWYDKANIFKSRVDYFVKELHEAQLRQGRAQTSTMMDAWMVEREDGLVDLAAELDAVELADEV
ncbi:uncharacterized protein HMPREF1541_03454 [Cyphellophora europaea CBS 101466]|uniref:Uncharacterized protein n=1 Tax=Cyphellophora europaea (strain CBS 101466) TaxID=1220924 RepID=W2S0F7_CYPE1|nr:uncharacterized protein HMPREF1541_03454 [Cyphellophora europaea CBS 101466]ETN41518.1 hypothetical protein HMPREF1541_03454 [Cyphellophora europaea CBS 101466]